MLLLSINNILPEICQLPKKSCERQSWKRLLTFVLSSSAIYRIRFSLSKHYVRYYTTITNQHGKNILRVLALRALFYSKQEKSSRCSVLVQNISCRTNALLNGTQGSMVSTKANAQGHNSKFFPSNVFIVTSIAVCSV